MNRRKNWFDRVIDESLTLKVVTCGLSSIMIVGVVRTILYTFGMNLTTHWYDAPFRWCVHLITMN